MPTCSHAHAQLTASHTVPPLLLPPSPRAHSHADEEFDPFLGEGTGAAALFGTTGGVMEAALRTLCDVATGERLERVVWAPVRGLEGIKEASVTIAPHPEGPLHNAEPVTVNIAVANGLGGWV